MFLIRQIHCDCHQRESITVKQEERIVSIELPLEHEDHEPFRTWKDNKTNGRIVDLLSDLMIHSRLRSK
jgi:hypothetical protein